VLRFEPDNWLEGLLRPLILADPSGFVYYEPPAPDLRFAAIAVFTGIVLAFGRLRARLSAPAWRTLLGLWLIFYLWVFSTGNGRYFVAGLLLAGPILVLLVGVLPFTRPMRVLVLAGLLGLQGLLVLQHFKHGMWTMVFWRDGPGLPIGKTALRTEPAVFITISSISHSILVPQFHPLSRWANVAGQADISQGMREHAPLRKLLAVPLPKYLVMHIVSEVPKEDEQPQGEMLELMRSNLARHGLELAARPCEVLRSHLPLQYGASNDSEPPVLAYWFCPLRDRMLIEPTLRPEPDQWSEVFDAVEQRCPRFFPPGGGNNRFAGAIRFRSYGSTDTRLYLSEGGGVYFRHQRALNPTLIGTADQVRRGDFTLECQKLPGRYVYPWERL
jgi:hypothetical protein